MSAKFKFLDLSRFQPKTKEELLAVDIAKALNDMKQLSFYIYYCNKYPDSLIRLVYGEIKAMPQGSIRNPLSFFNFLLMKHIQKARNGGSG
jgi:hypothetical protein